MKGFCKSAWLCTVEQTKMYVFIQLRIQLVELKLNDHHYKVIDFNMKSVTIRLNAWYFVSVNSSQIRFNKSIFCRGQGI